MILAAAALYLSLADAEKAAMEHSPVLKTAESNLEAAQAQVDSQYASLLPRLTLDGSYQYVTNVPKFSPGGPTSVPFGDHKNWSIGPTVSWTVFDHGALTNAWRSQKAASRSREQQLALLRRQVRLTVRLDYFQLQLALEQQRSLAESLALSEAQYRDIDVRHRAGAASRIDWLSAHAQVLDRQRSLRGAQADAAAAVRTLFAVMGRPLDVDPAMVTLQPLEDVEAGLLPAASATLDAAYPQLLVYHEQAESQRLQARSIEGGSWPRLLLTGRSYELYPNIPNLVSAWQNSGALSMTVPLFDYGQVNSNARAQRKLADASEAQKDEALDELERDWHKAGDEYRGYRDQEEIEKQSIEEWNEIARLRYASYRDGGSTILDVETANNDALLAKIVLATTRAQALMQLATLDSFSAPR
jgi:multidrug efflux system outer membrane protein